MTFEAGLFKNQNQRLLGYSLRQNNGGSTPMWTIMYRKTLDILVFFLFAFSGSWPPDYDFQGSAFIKYHLFHIHYHDYWVDMYDFI